MKLRNLAGILVLGWVLVNPISAQQITSIDPNEGGQGDNLTVTITGMNTRFLQGSGTTNVRLSKNASTISATHFGANSEISLEADFTLPATAETGFWNLGVTTEFDGNLTLVNGFQIRAAWSLPINVDVVNNAALGQSKAVATVQTSVLTIGGHPHATDGFDPNFDTSAPPPGFTYYVFLSIPEFPNTLLKDIRNWIEPFDNLKTWSIVITNATGITSNLTWNPSLLPPVGTLVLQDLITGNVIDMHEQSSYQVTGNSTLNIVYNNCVTYNFPIPGGAWYLISLPVAPDNASLGQLFPKAVSAFGWDYSTQNYFQTTTLEPKRAYWLLMLETDTVEVCGQSLTSYSTQYTEQGWDMIGSVLHSSPVFQDPSNSVAGMFGWDPSIQNYVAINPYVADPQKGYWLLIFGVPSTIGFGQGSSGGTVTTPKSAKHMDLAAFYKKYGTLPPPPPTELQQDPSIAVPSSPELSQNYPNPFNPGTIIEYRLQKRDRVNLKIYTVLGQEIKTLVNAIKEAGNYRVKWLGNTDNGARAESGIYLVRLQIGDQVMTRKAILVK